MSTSNNDIDIPTIIAISKMTGLWCSDYSKYLKDKQLNCNQNNQIFVKNNLELFGLIIYGILKFDGFILKNENDNDSNIIPWRSNSGLIKFKLINNKYPTNWIFEIKITSLFSSNYIMTINANLIHKITKLPNIQNWKIIFKIKSSFDHNELLSELFKSPLSEKFAVLIGNEIFQTYLKKFWNLFNLHSENINKLTFDEDKIIKLFNENKKYLDSFENKKYLESKRKLPFSYLTLQHIHLCFLITLILQYLQFQSLGTKNNDNITNDMIATTITRCMRYHRPFDANYKIILPNGKDIKYTKIRYISMEHCSLIIVNDQELIKSNLPSPKLKIILNRYIDNKGNIKNLSGRYSLIKLLCNNIIRRAKDPLSTSLKQFGLMNNKIFSIDILIILFSFINWRDLLNFGYCSQIAYNISNESELWKSMYFMEYKHDNNNNNTDHKTEVLNWKNKFIIKHKQNILKFQTKKK